MRNNRSVERAFQAGDNVVLAEGTYEGTTGVFLQFRKDVNWADVTEWNGRIRCHPIAWLAHAPASNGAPE